MVSRLWSKSTETLITLLAKSSSQQVPDSAPSEVFETYFSTSSTFNVIKLSSDQLKNILI